MPIIYATGSIVINSCFKIKKNAQYEAGYIQKLGFKFKKSKIVMNDLFSGQLFNKKAGEKPALIINFLSGGFHLR